MRVNVKGTLLMCHAAVDAFRRRVHQQAGQPPPSAAAIVNLGSINSFVTYPPSLKLSDGFNPVRTS
jgi:NAD(P)-dependent dehydrogenase (short-subunit alcohol dehydrogenase family)